MTTTTLDEFASQTGDVYAPVSIHPDFSDHAKVVKGAFVERLRANDITHVTWERHGANRYSDVIFVAGWADGEWGGDQ